MQGAAVGRAASRQGASSPGMAITATPRRESRFASRDFQNARHLFGLRNELAIMAALRKEMLGMGFLKISAPDFLSLGIWAAIASTGTRLRWQS